MVLQYKHFNDFTTTPYEFTFGNIAVTVEIYFLLGHRLTVVALLTAVSKHINASGWNIIVLINTQMSSTSLWGK